MEKIKILWRHIPTEYKFVEFFNIDVLPDSVELNNEFVFGGVCVLNEKAKNGCELFIFDGLNYHNIEWGIRSPWVEKTFVKAINKENARFQGKIKFQKNYNYLIIFLVVNKDNEILKIPIAELLYEPRLNLEEILIEPQNRLIFDIGANDGSDTIYYLMKGFRVVAVEPIPFLYDTIVKSLNKYIESERLIVIDKCIHEEDDNTVDFVINMSRTEWSSSHAYDKVHKAFKGECKIIKRLTISLPRLIKKYGSPYYLKIDIEGGEYDALKPLRNIESKFLPSFISFELNKHAFDIIELLYDIGYKKFQLIRQGEKFLPAPSFPSREGLEFRYPFKSSMSGPFGKDLPKNQWISLAGIIRGINEALHMMRVRQEKGEDPGWYDIHAKLNSEF